MEQFSDPSEEPRYRSWLRSHRGTGYVANRWWSGEVRLHRADCWTLTAHAVSPGGSVYRRTTPQYQKLCDDGTVRRLLAAVKKLWQPDDIRHCSKCFGRLVKSS